jgi:bacillolysin
MKKLILPIVILSLLGANIAAQKPKGLPNKTEPSVNIDDLQIPALYHETGFPEKSPIFQQTRQIKSLPGLQRTSDLPTGFKILATDDGLPTMIEGVLTLSNFKEQPLPIRATQYLDAVKIAMTIKNPSEEFAIKNINTDELGQSHVRMQQKLGGIPVWNGEVIVHEKQGRVALMSGNYFPTPSIKNLEPTVLKNTAEQLVKTDFDTKGGFKTLTDDSRKYIGGEQLRSELVIYHVKDDKNAEKLAWHIVAYPNMLKRYEYFVDAENGSILNSYGTSCDLLGHLHVGDKNNEKAHEAVKKEENTEGVAAGTPFLADGKAVANSTDLFDLTRTINTYQVATKYYLIDASKTMYNLNTSAFPNNPVGVIQTFDYKNTVDGPAYFISSTNNTWVDKKGVSAHYNAGKTYDYYLQTHGRNSINAQGNNIESFINVTETDETTGKIVQMDNAFWNGEAMFYGNGSAVFSALPKALDVAGHEISHGVIQNTANLDYQGESGAMNESFADVFGAMIDRDDWQMGEDIVVNRTYFPTGYLRDLSNPHNGGTSINNASWQPSNYNERYKGTDDNGGVHINSGIPNYAFYLFANNSAVGKPKAEKVYYRALAVYLRKASKFIDLRAAVEQSCKDLYPAEPALLTAAQNAFTQVGIGTGGSTTTTSTTPDIPINGGADWIVYVSDDGQKLLLTTPNNAAPTTLYSGGVNSRPSVTDDGSKIVFIGTDKKMHQVSINWATGTGTTTYKDTIIQNQAVWSNVAISKDGRKLAGNFAKQDSIIWVFSYDLPAASSVKTFVLYNPTTAAGKKSYTVRYSDALEWDHYGEYIMYDAFSSIPSADGAKLEYWDVGFMNVWSNTDKKFSTGNIEKLFNNLPEGTSIGNPTFSKNSAYIVAFDLIESSALLGDSYYVYGANIQTGVLTADGTQGQRGIVANNTLGVPSFSRQDNRILYTAAVSKTVNQLKSITLASNKIDPANSTATVVPTNANRGNWFGNAKRVIISATNELDKTQVRISPNPFSDVLSIDISSENAGQGKAEMFDLLGRHVSTTPLSISTGKNAVSIDTHQLQTGTYLLKISVGNNTLTSKVVKF